MNFLAHAWVLPAGGPDLVLGAALPDLLGAFDRRAPRLTREAPARLAAAGAPELARGVHAHLLADACFHQLSAFREACAALAPLSAALNAAGARVRGFFLSHLLVEVLLDAELARTRQQLAPGFYEALARSDLRGGAQATARAAGSPRDLAGFDAFVARFLEARFLFDYATDAGVVHRVEQVLGRVRQRLGPAGREELLRALPAARVEVRARASALTAAPRDAVRQALNGS